MKPNYQDNNPVRRLSWEREVQVLLQQKHWKTKHLIRLDNLKHTEHYDEPDIQGDVFTGMEMEHGK